MRPIMFLLLFLFMLCVPACAQEGPVVGGQPQDVQIRFVEDPQDLRAETWVQGLEAPWSLIFLPDGRALVSERPGRIRLIQGGRLLKQAYARIDAEVIGEGGLMGLAVHPDFPEKKYVYAMYTYREKGELFNRVQRFQDLGSRGQPDKIILDGIPGARYHNGGRIGFGPDRMLYITAGENFRASLAQELTSLAGSILRVTPDGSMPADNPFQGSPIWSFGHRNPQGLAWHPQTGELFASEHGPSGEFGLHGHDIVNVIHKGANYGWPLEVGAGGLQDYEDPLIMWKKTTPPAGMTFWKGELYLSTLRSEVLLRIRLEPEKDKYIIKSIAGLYAKERYNGVFGRLRDAVAGPDGALYVLTSNRDGRGSPRQGDDRILKITAN